MKYSKGVMWLDDCRIPFVDDYGDKKGNDNKKRSGDVYGFSTYESLYVRAEPNQQGRFTPNLLVCDDMLNDGIISLSKKGKERQVKNYGLFGGGHTNSKNEYNDKGTNSRYYDLDLWFQKMIEKL